MNTYTAHVRDGRWPVLVPEGFSWSALFFGPVWLARHGAWVAGGLALAVLVLACLVPPTLRPPSSFGVLLMLGVLGQDLRRWELGLRGWQVAHVVAARSPDEALLRLLTSRADLLARQVA